MHRLFAEALAGIGAEVSFVTGSGPSREKAATAAVADALAKRSHHLSPAS